VLTFVQDYCQNHASAASREVQRCVSERFGLSVSVSQLNRVRATHGLSRQAPPQEKKSRKQASQLPQDIMNRPVACSYQYSPVIFNLEEAGSKDFIATVRTLANMARFVLIDMTDLKGVIREIADAIVPHCVVPIQSLLLQGSREQEYEHFRAIQYKHRGILAPYRYHNLSELQSSFQEKILQPIHERIIELKQKKPLKMFIGYAPEDKDMLNMLKIHLRLLGRMGLIEVYDDQDVAPGEEKGKEIERRLSVARIILLLISPDFLNSHECYDIQMSRAIERYELGEARVIPIILRPCAWRSTPLQKLMPLPKNGEPISKRDKDEIFFEVSEEIGDVIRI
jgi:hypothetical protein